MNTNAMPLSLYGETFHALKTDFDSIINRTVGNMEMKGADEATVTIKVKVKLEKTTARDLLANGYDGLRDVVAPTFNHEVTSVMQVKDKKTGRNDEGYELVWDDKEKRYIMRKVDDGQISMDEYVDQAAEPAGLPAPAEPPAEKDDKRSDFMRWLTNFVDVDLTVHEANGIFTLRDDENSVVLSSGCDHDSPAYLSEDKLAPHIGHLIYILDNGNRLDVICDTCGKTITSFSDDEEEVPTDANDEHDEAGDTVEDEELDDAAEDYEYEDPEDEEE